MNFYQVSLFVTENIQINILSNEIHFENILNLASALLDSLNIKHNLKQIKANALKIFSRKIGVFSKTINLYSNTLANFNVIVVLAN